LHPVSQMPKRLRVHNGAMGNVAPISPGTHLAVDIEPNTARSFPGRFSGQAGSGAAERSIQRLGGELVLQSGACHHDGKPGPPVGLLAPVSHSAATSTTTMPNKPQSEFDSL